MLDVAMGSLGIPPTRQGAFKRLAQARGQEIKGEGSSAQIRYPVVLSTPASNKGESERT